MCATRRQVKNMEAGVKDACRASRELATKNSDGRRSLARKTCTTSHARGPLVPVTALLRQTRGRRRPPPAHRPRQEQCGVSVPQGEPPDALERGTPLDSGSEAGGRRNRRRLSWADKAIDTAAAAGQKGHALPLHGAHAPHPHAYALLSSVFFRKWRTCARV